MQNNNGVVKYNPKNKTLEQVYENLSLREAYGKVGELRRLNDGSYYWIGRVENHLGLIR